MSRRKDIKVGNTVEGIMGVDGGKQGTIVEIGAPFSTSGAASVYVKAADGTVWDTYDFNLRKI